MKIRPSPKRGRVVVEVDRRDERLLSEGSATAPGGAIPFSLQHLLVPIDFSECARMALQYALPLARQFGSRLTLLYVMPINYFVGSEFGPVDFPVPEAEWRQTSERELRALAERELAGAVAATTLVRQGQPAHEIVRCARELAVDLIVLSTHGRTGLRHVLVGSVAENVVRYAPCPVWVVRQPGREPGKGTRRSAG